MFNFFKFNANPFNSRRNQTSFSFIGDVEIELEVSSEYSFVKAVKKKKGGGRYRRTVFSFTLSGRRALDFKYKFNLIGKKIIQFEKRFFLLGKKFEKVQTSIIFNGQKQCLFENRINLNGRKLNNFSQKYTINALRRLDNISFKSCIKGTKTSKLIEKRYIEGKKINSFESRINIFGRKTVESNKSITLNGEQDNTALFAILFETE